MLVYRLQIWLFDDDLDEGLWRDFYFDVKKISGWYIPDLKDNNQKSINIFFDGDVVTIKQEPHILEYLSIHFGNNAIKP